MTGEKPHSNAEACDDGRLSALSALRNMQPILEAIAPYVPKGGVALEVASGTGEHAVALAREYPETIWQPTDIAPDRLVSIDGWRVYRGVSNMRAAQALDATAPSWRLEPFALAVTVNLFHLISKSDVQAVMRGIVRNLTPGGHWFVYGPFRSGGAFRSDADRAFHAALTAHDPQIGYKDVEALETWAADVGLTRVALIEMPANNLALVLRH